VDSRITCIVLLHKYQALMYLIRRGIFLDCCLSCTLKVFSTISRSYSAVWMNSLRYCLMITQMSSKVPSWWLQTTWRHMERCSFRCWVDKGEKQLTTILKFMLISMDSWQKHKERNFRITLKNIWKLRDWLICRISTRI
jgi:predicted deacetylase